MFQVAAEIAAGAVQAGLHSGLGKAEGVAGLLAGQAFQITEDQDFAVLRLQGCNCSMHGVDQSPLLQCGVRVQGFRRHGFEIGEALTKGPSFAREGAKHARARGSRATSGRAANFTNASCTASSAS